MEHQRSEHEVVAGFGARMIGDDSNEGIQSRVESLDSSERYFPAFQFVVWAGKSAREAMDSSMLETSGRA